jgi:hypothetical protein
MSFSRDRLGLQTKFREHLHKDFRDLPNANVVRTDAGMPHVIHQPLDESLLAHLDMVVYRGERRVHVDFLSGDGFQVLNPMYRRDSIAKFE